MAESKISDDKSLGPVYFWRETEVPYGFMSQWYESTFEVDGVAYVSAEMWMMIQKARLFGDEVRNLAKEHVHKKKQKEGSTNWSGLTGNGGEDDEDYGTQRASGSWSKGTFRIEGP